MTKDDFICHYVIANSWRLDDVGIGFDALNEEALTLVSRLEESGVVFDEADLDPRAAILHAPTAPPVNANPRPRLQLAPDPKSSEGEVVIVDPDYEPPPEFELPPE